MAHPIPTTEPSAARIGDTWQWSRADLSDYPAPAWSLVYHFRNASDYFDITASADGAAFAVSVLPAVTGALAAGRYSWAAFVSDGTNRYEVDSGELEVLPDLAAAAPQDMRRWAQRVLDAIEATLENRATTDQLDLVNGTAADLGFTRDRAGLLEMHSQFRLEVKRVNGSGGLKRIVTRF